LNHPLAEALLARAKNRLLPTAELYFDYARHEGKVSILEPFIGSSGWLQAAVFTVESFDQSEDHIILAAITDQGQTLDEETAARLISLPAEVITSVTPASQPGSLEDRIQKRKDAIQKEISERNARFFEEEAEKLDGWSDDLKVGLEREIKEMDRQIKEARRDAATAQTLEEKLAGQKQIKSVESLRNQKRRSLFDAQDEIDRQRGELIASIEDKLQQVTQLDQVFLIRWRLQ
jgi:adenine-specific DNA-methyltransferase